MAGQDQLINYDKDYLQSFHQEDASGVLLRPGSPDFSLPLVHRYEGRHLKATCVHWEDFGEV